MGLTGVDVIKIFQGLYSFDVGITDFFGKQLLLLPQFTQEVALEPDRLQYIFWAEQLLAGIVEIAGHRYGNGSFKFLRNVVSFP